MGSMNTLPTIKRESTSSLDRGFFKMVWHVHFFQRHPITCRTSLTNRYISGMSTHSHCAMMAELYHLQCSEQKWRWRETESWTISSTQRSWIEGSPSTSFPETERWLPPPTLPFPLKGENHNKGGVLSANAPKRGKLQVQGLNEVFQFSLSCCSLQLNRSAFA